MPGALLSIDNLQILLGVTSASDASRVSIHQYNRGGEFFVHLFKRYFNPARLQTRIKNRRVHMANERTFLAWIRTSLGIMGFGILIEKVLAAGANSQLDELIGPSVRSKAMPWLGVTLVILGAISGVLAAYRFMKAEKEIIEDTYRPSIATDMLVALMIAVVGILIVVYLVSYG
jgi:putative membrane protein